MKGLRQFLKFDTTDFFADKTLVALAVSPTFEYVNGEKTNNILGCKIESVIGVDNTKYSKDGISNAFEKINIKIIDTKEFNIPQMSRFKIKSFEKATVYGAYQNQLSVSVKASSIQILDEKNQ